MNWSDRFLAKVSDTDPKRGNSPKRVAEALRKYWTVLENEWPTIGVKTLQEFYAEIPQQLKALALAHGAQWDFGYEFVPTSKATLKQALKYSPVCIAVPAWYENNDGKYYRPPQTADGHWTVLYGFNDKDEYLVYDTYEPHRKVMVADFTPSIAMRYHLKKRPTSMEPNLFVRLVRALIEYAFPKPPQTAPPPQDSKKKELLDRFALAVKKHEGYALPGETIGGVTYTRGSLSYRCRNPGNCRYNPSGYLDKYGFVGEWVEGLDLKPGQRGFAIFKDYATGYLYLQNLILTKAQRHPNWNLEQFFGDEKDGWAPNSDNNNSKHYAKVVAQAMGVSPTAWRLSNLL